jgi:hypothetical protein
MTSPSIVFRPRSGVRLLSRAMVSERLERLVRVRIAMTWGLLFFNTLTYFPHSSILPFPGSVGKALAQSALPAALLMALSINRKLIVRPNVFLCLVTLLVAGTIVTTLQPEHFGTIYRTVRFGGFVACLWLLTPWWGRRDVLLLRCHLGTLQVLIGSIILGFLVAPSRSRPGGRLFGYIWPMTATQVAHYAAVAAGLVIVLWFCGHLRSRSALISTIVSLVVLLMSHTRTALAALIAGIAIAGFSLVTVKPRVRKLFAAVGVIATIAVLTSSALIATWLARGQSQEGLNNLTGRTEVWGPLLAFPRDKFQEIFGFGLSNASFNSFPIDSNWLASYQQQGLYGMILCAIILLFLLVAAFFQPRGSRRALALFLVTYCLIASFTEVGFTDASPYLLDLAVAASLILPSPESSSPP